MSRLASQLWPLVQELRQRRVARALLAYGAGAAAVLQGAEMICTALALPDLAYRIMVIASLVGFPVVAVLAWVYDLTAQGLRRTSELSPEQGRAPIPVSRYLQLIGAFAFSALIVVATAGAVSSLRYPASDDGRVGLAIFPLRTSGPVGDAWSEGTADLLATALQGTPSLRVVDPWSLWRPLRDRGSAAARPPDVEQAESLTEDVGAHRYLLGSVVGTGKRIELAFRIYRVGRAEPLDAFTISTGPDSMASAVGKAAVRVLARVWGPLRPPDVPSELDFDATQSPEALKAYLAATAAMRRGMIDSANTAIDRAVALDSTFVLAIVEAVRIKSWGFGLRGQPYLGFFRLLARAEPFEAKLDERSRLRLEATQASLKTNGPAALAATTRILQLDPLDYGANSRLEYYRRAYGWQLTPPAFGSRELAERVVQLDSTQLPALTVREWWAVSLLDTADERVQLRRIQRVDTTSVLARTRIRGLRALLASDEAFDAMLPDLVDVPFEDFVDLIRHLRAGNQKRYRLFLEAVTNTPEAPNRPAALGELVRLDVSQGRAAAVDSMLEAGVYPPSEHVTRATVELLVVAAGLTGVAEAPSVDRAASSLAHYIQPDSVLDYFETRPVWWTCWLLGAWNAQAEDTLVAHRWMDVIGTLPAGGTSEDYRGALRSDIEARLALRRGDREAALTLERTAVDLWTIHNDNTLESWPSPTMRLTLGLLLREEGRDGEATALLSSLVPPTTWMGFVTARAELELGEMAAQAGDFQEARLHFRRVLGLWGEGGPTVSGWADRARAGLAAIPDE